MRSLQTASLALLGGIVLFAWIASPAAAGTIYTLQPGNLEIFRIDPDGPDGADAVDYDITFAGFDLDTDTGVLSDFQVYGSVGVSEASLLLDAPVTLTPPRELPADTRATLTMDGSSSTVLVADGVFVGDALLLTFTFVGGGEGISGPPDLDALLFTAQQDGELPNASPIPEPSGVVLFAVGLLLVASSLRGKSV